MACSFERPAAIFAFTASRSIPSGSDSGFGCDSIPRLRNRIVLRAFWFCYHCGFFLLFIHFLFFSGCVCDVSLGLTAPNPPCRAFCGGMVRQVDFHIFDAADALAQYIVV
jgi:hypothetical protein